MMDIKTYDPEQFGVLMAVGHTREHFKLSGAGIETWYRPRAISSGSDYRGDFVEMSFDQLSEAVKVPVPSCWNGPDDGLPPVGTVCEHEGRADDREWIEVKVIAHTEKRGREVAVFEYEDIVSYSTAIYFRPIRTPEQIAAEEREQGIKELMDWVLGMGESHLVRSPFPPFWAAAYDEGLRAPVKP